MIILHLKFSYWCTGDDGEEQVEFETPTKVSDNEQVETSNVETSNVESETDAPVESYCDCLAPSECATLVDLFHQGRFHDLTYYESCGYYEYQPYFCCPPLTTEHYEHHDHEHEHEHDANEHHTEVPTIEQPER